MSTATPDIELIREICEYQPESAIWVKPVWDNSEVSGAPKIVDFEFHYCNPTSEKLTGQPRDQIVGKCILENKLPDPGASQLIFDQCLQVYNSGHILEYSYFSTSLEKYLSLTRIKVRGGVLTTARNRTEEYNTKVKKEEQERLLNSIIENSPYGICLYESVRDDNRNIIDFKLRLCNEKSSEITALSLDQLHTMSVKELMKMRGQSGYLEIGIKVVETGEPYYMEYYSTARSQWLGFSFVKFEDGYLLNYIDITITKRYEQEAKYNAEELNAIFNGSLSGVYSAKLIRDPNNSVTDLIFVRANEGFYRMFPSLPDSIAGKTLLSVAGKDDQTSFLEFVRGVVETGQPAIQILNYRDPDRWYELSIVKLSDEMISVTVNGITAQKAAMVEIEHQKKLLDNIMKYSPNGLSITKAIRNEKGEMIDAISVLMNNACEKINGAPNEIVLANSIGNLEPGVLSSPIFKQATKLEVGESFHSEYFINPTKTWLELAVARMDEDHFINVFTDISAIKEIQQQLENSIMELKKSNASLGDFAYAASHDLQEPIRKIRFFLEQLKDDHDYLLDEKGRRVFHRIEIAANRMKQLVEDLLEYSWVNQGVSKFERINLQDILVNVLDDLELSILEQKAVIKMSNLPMIKGNKRQIQQLFQNLIDNALKYHKPGTGHIVSISANKILGKDIPVQLSEEEKLKFFQCIEVKDNGIGFELKDAERIFNVFTRLHGNSDYKGSGVGLAIVRKVVENHNGYIKAEGIPGVGATFNIFLPD